MQAQLQRESGAAAAFSGMRVSGGGVRASDTRLAIAFVWTLLRHSVCSASTMTHPASQCSIPHILSHPSLLVPLGVRVAAAF